MIRPTRRLLKMQRGRKGRERRGLGAYHADAVHFDSGTDFLTWAVLSGVVDGRSGLLNFWRKAANPDGSFLLTLNANCVTFSNSSPLNLFLSDEAGSNYLNADWAVSIADNAWHHVLVSWDTDAAAGARTVQMYIDDVSRPATLDEGGVAFDAFYEDPDGWHLVSQGTACDIADVALYLNQFIDLSVVANRRKFISGAHKPVDPANFPAGAVILLSGDATGFATNQGSGGAPVLTGTLTNAATSPSD